MLRKPHQKPPEKHRVAPSGYGYFTHMGSAFLWLCLCVWASCSFPGLHILHSSNCGALRSTWPNVVFFPNSPRGWDSSVPRVSAGRGHWIFYWGLCAIQLRAFPKQVSQVPMAAPRHPPTSPGVSASQVSWAFSLRSCGLGPDSTHLLPTKLFFSNWSLLIPDVTQLASETIGYPFTRKHKQWKLCCHIWGPCLLVRKEILLMQSYNVVLVTHGKTKRDLSGRGKREPSQRPQFPLALHTGTTWDAPITCFPAPASSQRDENCNTLGDFLPLYETESYQKYVTFACIRAVWILPPNIHFHAMNKYYISVWK